MHDTIKPQPGFLKITPYVGGAASVMGDVEILKLSSNENPLGPSPKAIVAYKAVGADLHLYPSADHSSLRQAIAEVYGLDAGRIVCGAGSNELISFLCRTYAGSGDEVILTEHGFEMYKIGALGAGATPILVSEADRTTDPAAMIAAFSERTKLVFLANPNNPTGTMTSKADILAIADALPPQAMLILDGAYAEYVAGYEGGASLVEQHDNIVMLRTFSKIYGLSSLRIGWGYMPAHVIDIMQRVRGPFNVSAAALAAAEAAVRDQDYIDHCRALNTECLGYFSTEMAAMGIPSDPAFGNFLLFRFKDEQAALDLDAALSAQGILVRRVGNYNLPNCLRITVGGMAGCKRVVAAVRAHLGAVS